MELRRWPDVRHPAERVPEPAAQSLVVGPHQPERAVYGFDHHELLCMAEGGEPAVDDLGNVGCLSRQGRAVNNNRRIPGVRPRMVSAVRAMPGHPLDKPGSVGGDAQDSEQLPEVEGQPTVRVLDPKSRFSSRLRQRKVVSHESRVRPVTSRDGCFALPRRRRACVWPRPRPADPTLEVRRRSSPCATPGLLLSPAKAPLWVRARSTSRSVGTDMRLPKVAPRHLSMPRMARLLPQVTVCDSCRARLMLG